MDDLLGLSVIGRCKDTRRWLSWSHAWGHPSVFERRKSEVAKLLDFEKDGDFTLVKQAGDDTKAVADITERIYQSGLLDKIGIDPAGIGGLLDEIVQRGVEQDSIVGISQGWRLGGAIQTTERKLAEKILFHGGQPLMNWCVGNARVEPKGNAILITKQASGRSKIDPLMALFNAVSLMALNPEPAKNSTKCFSYNSSRSRGVFYRSCYAESAFLQSADSQISR